MDAIREQFKNPMRVGAAGLLLGLILGVLYGWFIDPVEWVDQPVEMLRADLKQEYLRMAIDSYAVNPDPALAKKRFEDLGTGGASVLAQVMRDPGVQNPQVIFCLSDNCTGWSRSTGRSDAGGCRNGNGSGGLPG